jgi:glycine betaine/proline transport system permease protein
MMQTIPTFVYLIPIITLMGIGKVPGLIAVCVYAIPPVVRLTSLGLKQVPYRYIETAMALGLNNIKILLMIKFPIALLIKP